MTAASISLQILVRKSAGFGCKQGEHAEAFGSSLSVAHAPCVSLGSPLACRPWPCVAPRTTAQPVAPPALSVVLDVGTCSKANQRGAHGRECRTSWQQAGERPRRARCLPPCCASAASKREALALPRVSALCYPATARRYLQQAMPASRTDYGKARKWCLLLGHDLTVSWGQGSLELRVPSRPLL